MGPNKVNAGLKDGSHPDLINRSDQKGSKGTSKSTGLTTGGASQSHAHHVLPSNKTLNEVLRVLLLEYLREGRVLVVPVQHNDSIICMAQLSQSQTASFPSSYLLTNFVNS